MDNILQVKKELRCKLRLLRSQSDQFHLKNTPLLTENIFRYISLSCSKNNRIACFWPLENEADLRPLIKQLHQSGYQVALPKTPVKGNALSFYVWYPTAPMQEGRYKTIYPDTEILSPDLILVPLMAFDRYGNRLGYGGGYYDRTLQQFPDAKPVGVAFSYQEVAEVPTEEFDYKLPVILTELETIYT